MSASQSDKLHKSVSASHLFGCLVLEFATVFFLTANNSHFIRAVFGE